MPRGRQHKGGRGRKNPPTFSEEEPDGEDHTVKPEHHKEGHCQPWCDTPCEQLNGDLEDECGECKEPTLCRPGATNFDDWETRRKQRRTGHEAPSKPGEDPRGKPGEAPKHISTKPGEGPEDVPTPQARAA